MTVSLADVLPAFGVLVAAQSSVLVVALALWVVRRFLNLAQ